MLKRLPKYHSDFYDFAKTEELVQVSNLYKLIEELRKEVNETRKEQLKIVRRFEQKKRRNALRCKWQDLSPKEELDKFYSFETKIFWVKKQKAETFKKIKTIKNNWQSRFDRFRKKTKQKTPAITAGEYQVMAFRQGVKRAPSRANRE